MSADTDRCPHCRIAFGNYVHGSWYELDTGEHHTVVHCRDYLVAERDRLKKKLDEVQTRWDRMK